ncbi:hypothetical protein ACQ9LF_01895 [Anaerohalosphaeraceae bacterium U12dextr]
MGSIMKCNPTELEIRCRRGITAGRQRNRLSGWIRRYHKGNLF